MKRIVFFLFLMFICLPVFSQTFGIWMLVEARDQFGDPTGQKYIMTSGQITGSFSNGMVSGAGLAVFIAYASGMGPVFELQEFGRTPLFSFGNEIIVVNFQDKNKKNYSAEGRIDGGMIYIHPDQRELVLSALRLGGTVKFRIRINTPIDTSDYAFDIPNADGFDRAFAQIGG
jgi:hypothetical protein